MIWTIGPTVPFSLSSFIEHSLLLLFLIVWSENPTITIIETMSYPIEKVIFPTVTLCPQNNDPDRWGPIIKIFDHFQRRCSSRE